MKTPMHRRQFMSAVLKTGATVALFPHMNAFAAPLTRASALGARFDAAPDSDHFFLFITLPDPSGLDFTYLFDSRPMEMTANNILQNYRPPGEPAVWTGANGTSTLVTGITTPLQPFKNYFSIINGVSMSQLDGHDQNINYLYSGNTFGGESFIPHLNRVGSECPLDDLQRGPVRATLSNSERTVPLTPPAAAALVKRLKAVPPFDTQSELFRQLGARFAAAAAIDPNGDFSIGSAKMQSGFQNAPALATMLNNLQVSEDDTNTSFVNMLGQFFKAGAVRSATMSLVLGDPATPPTFDVHDSGNAKKLPDLCGRLVAALVEILGALRSTPYDDKRSLMDVTTFMFSAEFGRTMRQYGHPIDDTGTDHNQYANSILIGGKGVVPGLVLGQTDFQTSKETVSPAHLSFDPAQLKMFGRPFDFKTFKPRTDLPASYVFEDYLNFNSVANTVYKVFSMPDTYLRKVERNGPVAPVLSPLIG